MTTAPVLGQPAAACPVAPHSGRARLLAVPVLVIARAVCRGVLRLGNSLGLPAFARPLEAEQLRDGPWQTGANGGTRLPASVLAAVGPTASARMPA